MICHCPCCTFIELSTGQNYTLNLQCCSFPTESSFEKCLVLLDFVSTHFSSLCWKYTSLQYIYFLSQLSVHLGSLCIQSAIKLFHPQSAHSLDKQPKKNMSHSVYFAEHWTANNPYFIWCQRAVMSYTLSVLLNFTMTRWPSMYIFLLIVGPLSHRPYHRTLIKGFDIVL